MLISNIILGITVAGLNEIKQITPPNVTVRRCFCVVGKSGAKLYGKWSCGEKAIGFVKEHLEEHKKENHAVIAWLNKASYFLFVSPKR